MKKLHTVQIFIIFILIAAAITLIFVFPLSKTLYNDDLRFTDIAFSSSFISLSNNLWERPASSEGLEHWENENIQLANASYVMFRFTTYSGSESGDTLNAIMYNLCRLADEKAMYSSLDEDIIGGLSWLSANISTDTENYRDIAEDVCQRLSVICGGQADVRDTN